MRVSYDALVRGSQALAYWPLGRHLGKEVIGGLDFDFTVNRLDVEGDSVWSPENGTVTRNIVMTATDNFSVEIWFRPESQKGGGAGIWQNANGGSNGYSLDIPGTTNTGDLRFRCVAQSVALLATSARPMRYRSWNHIVIQRNAGTWVYYLNGNLDTANAGTNAPITPSVTTGIKGATSGAAYVKGFALYTRVLSASEIRYHWMEGREDAPLILLATLEQAPSGDIEAPFIAATTVLFDQEMDRPVFILPLLLRWSQN